MSIMSGLALMLLRKEPPSDMPNHSLVHFGGYMPVGDIAVTLLCFLMFALLFQTYAHRQRNFYQLLAVLVATCLSVSSNVVYQLLLFDQSVASGVIYGIRVAHHVVQSLIMYFYIRYLEEPFWIKRHIRQKHNVLVLSVIGLATVVDIVGSVLHFTFWIDPEGTTHSQFNPYVVLNALMNLFVFVMIIRYRGRVIRQIFWGLFSSNIIGFATLMIQGVHGQVSFTGLAYFLPVLALIFIFHASPYSADTGAASESFFYHELDDKLEKKKTMVLISCTMLSFNQLIKESRDLKLFYYDFIRQNVQRGVIYQFPNDRMVLAVEKNFDTAQDRFIDKVLENFQDGYAKFKLDYKMILLETTPEITSSIDYIRLIEFAEQTIAYNTIYHISENDIKRFYNSSYILSELEDIVKRRDLDDERVLVYCQPVFNIRTGTYDTAEALMRLKLPNTGIVFPDQFIPIAEQHGLIHMMSLIILNKTCGSIRTLMEDGYEINRISVNFSTLDIRYENFCQEVQQIIARNQVPYEKIAIEITESRSESDFNLMKSKVKELQQLGIKFYLDDFGTGYSNFERIMEIPFDIIKFDRSMLIESSKSDSSFYMVSTFANMFDKLHYSVLFEGIENDMDERSCVKMSAKYLQGYKYSRPIPIEQLTNFLESAAS